jgi:hypothetical protein
MKRRLRRHTDATSIDLWIAAIVLALAMLGAGSMKLIRSREQIVAMGMGYAAHFPLGAIITHVRLRDPLGQSVPAVVLLLLAILVAWGRLGTYAF